MRPRPIIDLHCDLLAYLANNYEKHPDRLERLGCSPKFLTAGGVRAQVMAIYTDQVAGRTDSFDRQVTAYRQLVSESDGMFTADLSQTDNDKIIALLAVENAGGMCGDNERIDSALRRLEMILADFHIIYISLTYNAENLFGGGMATEVGLSDTGRELLKFMAEHRIAADISHASDQLALDILNHAREKLPDLKVLASHSNYRAICSHRRNLTDELARGLIELNGLIGVNFLRHFLDLERPEAMADHLQHGLSLGAENAFAFGADFFDTEAYADPKREPFYFERHRNASKYPTILEELAEFMSEDQLDKLANENACRFLSQLWPELSPLSFASFSARS